jgi:hypothetical protein
MFRLKNTILDESDLNKIQGSLGVPAQTTTTPPVNAGAPTPMMVSTPMGPSVSSAQTPAPQPRVGFWDVLKQVPSAGVTVGRDIIGGVMKPFAKAAATMKAINYGTRGVAEYGVRRLFGDKRGAQEALDKNMAEANRGINLPIVGNVKPLATGPKGMVEAVTTGAEIGTTLLPQALLEKSLGRVAITKAGIKVLPEVLSVTEKRIVETAGKEQLTHYRSTLQKIMDAVTGAKEIRGEQEALHSIELEKRVAAGEIAAAGKTGTEAELARSAALGGKYPKPGYEPLISSGKVTAQDFETVNTIIQDSPMLLPLQKKNASEGLRALFGLNPDGSMMTAAGVPEPYDLAQLERVLGEDFVKAILRKRPLVTKIRDAIWDTLQGLKTFVSSGDLSASFRQLLPTVGTKEYWKNFPNQFKYWVSERSFLERQNALFSDPEVQLFVKHGLQVQGLGKTAMNRPEVFHGTWPEKIPLIGTFIVKPSERAFTGFMNDVAVDLARTNARALEAAGIEGSEKIYGIKRGIDLINDLTGHAKNIFSKSKSGKSFSHFFFWSPSLASSRIRILARTFYEPMKAAFDVFVPGKYVAADTVVRKRALKTFLGFASLATTVLGLGKLTGAKIETDPTNTDFMKLRYGNKVFDQWGGMQQYIVFLSRLFSGFSTSPTSGARTYYGEGYRPETRLDLAIRFAGSKASPLAGFIVDWLRGRNYEGESAMSLNEVKNKFIPLVYQDMWDLMQDSGFLRGLGLSIPSIFGIGSQVIPQLSEPERLKLQNKSERQHLKEQQKKKFDAFK